MCRITRTTRVEFQKWRRRRGADGDCEEQMTRRSCGDFSTVSEGPCWLFLYLYESLEASPNNVRDLTRHKLVRAKNRFKLVRANARLRRSNLLIERLRRTFDGMFQSRTVNLSYALHFVGYAPDLDPFRNGGSRSESVFFLPKYKGRIY